MAITINGSGTVTGISVGGLPDGIVDDGTLATSAVTSTKILDGTITNADINASAAIAGSKVDGSFGKVLQVKSETKTDTYSVSQGSGTFANIPDLSITITPASTASKFLISFSVNLNSSGRYSGLRLTRGSTVIGVGDQVGTYRTPVTVSVASNPAVTYDYYVMQNSSMTYQDSPSTTAALTYNVQVGQAHSTSTQYINRQGTDGDSAFYLRGVSTITVMEIGV
jgi:hypothetical protein